MTKGEAAGINGLMPGNQVYGVGDRLKAIMDAAGSIGEVYYLDPTNGVDTNDGRLGAPVKTLAVGYALLRDGYNDVLVYVSGPSSISLPAGFTWAKSYAHFIGACAPVPFSPRSRVFLAAAATGGETYLMNITGSGCVFSNILFFMGVDKNTAAYSVVVTGSRNYFKGVHFAGIGHATMDVSGAGDLLLDGGSENLFDGCTIGTDTIERGANSRNLMFKTAASRNVFKNCTFIAHVSNAGHALAAVYDGTGIDRVQKFENCHFIADSTNRATALTSVFAIPAGIAQGMIDLDIGCHVSSWGAAAAWDSNSRGIISAAMTAPTAAGAGGISTHK
jgi:hypothetical protein